MNNRDMHFKEAVLFEAIKMTVAQGSILVEKGCTDPERLQQYLVYYSCIAMKAYSNFYELNKEYTGKEIAIKKFHSFYFEYFNEKNHNIEELVTHLRPELYQDCSENEQFLILALCTLYTNFKTKSVIKTRHILNTYIPKIRACLKNTDDLVQYFDLKKISSVSAKAKIFEFLVENG